MNKYRVVVVEDDEDDWDFLKEAFDKVDCMDVVQHYRTSTKLLESLASSSIEQHPDLIVLDHLTPLLNSSETVRQIRTNKNFDHIALVVYSTAVSPSLQEKLLQQGVDLCVTKGSSAKDIINEVKEFFELVHKKQNSTDVGYKK